MRIGIRDVAAEGGFDVGEHVAAGTTVPVAEVFGTDAEFAHSAGEPILIDLAPAAEVFPGAVVAGIEGGDDVAAEDAVGVGGEHEGADVAEEVTDEGKFVLVGGAEFEGGLARDCGPVAAGEVGDGEERFPDVCGAIVEGARDIGPGAGDGVAVLVNEGGAAFAEFDGVQLPEALAPFARELALHGDDNAAVGKGVGEAADGGHDFGAPAGVLGEIDGAV